MAQGRLSLFHGQLPSTATCPGLLDASEAHYRERADELCAAAGLTCDDLRMRLDAAPGGQVGRIRVWREIEREGRVEERSRL